MSDTPLSLEAASELLMGPEPEEQNTPEAQAEPAAEVIEDNGDQTPSDGDTPETDSEADDDSEEQGEPKSDIAPPPFWSADAKEHWDQLPPATQEYVRLREQQRDAATSKAIGEAANERKAASQERAQVSELVSQLDGVLDTSSQVFSDRWANIDWYQLSQADPAQYVQLKAEFEADQHDLQQLHLAKQKAEQVSRQATLEAEAEKLSALAPELAANAEEKGRVAQYLINAGLPAEVLPDISASELIIAHKAMLYDQLKAQGFKPKQSSSPVVTGQKAVKPSATAPRVSAETQRIQQLKTKRSLSLDEAAELFM